VDDFGTGVGAAVPEKICSAVPGLMGEQITDRDLAGRVRLMKLESAQKLRDTVVPVELAPVFQDAECDRGECLAV